MSTLAFVQGPNGVLAAWDTDGQIYFSTISRGTTEFVPPRSVPGRGQGRKHPALAVKDDAIIVVWTEETGWQKGGALAWQVFDRDGKATAQKGRMESAIPVWGLPSVVAVEGGFVVFH